MLDTVIRENNQDDIFIEEIERQDNILMNYFAEKMIVDDRLTRRLVSFQANKKRTYYRWYKYKEAFSADLVEYFLKRYNIKEGKILDPFAGIGTALFTCSALGYPAEGIEVLPVGQKIIEANILARGNEKQPIISVLERWAAEQPWNRKGKKRKFEIFRITDRAYPNETYTKIKRYLNDIEGECAGAQEILLFTLLCVAESISYTRKDGQYLRWDYRAGRKNGKTAFDKGKILSFDEALVTKLNEIKNDIEFGDRKNDLLSFMQKNIPTGKLRLYRGSCLDILPQLESNTYTGIITSPPYCNRYDYTRTYALEHALLGVKETELSNLRQAMLSCTVENKAKELVGRHREWERAVNICDSLPLLQQILQYLDYKKEKRELNNNGIARMVRGYFYEIACVIQECYRVLEKGSMMFMVNDNVRYAGAALSVDTILSKIAEELGFRIKNILVLPQGKGNSSQQMGRHGRAVLRKCVYVWEKG